MVTLWSWIIETKWTTSPTVSTMSGYIYIVIHEHQMVVQKLWAQVKNEVLEKSLSVVVFIVMVQWLFDSNDISKQRLCSSLTVWHAATDVNKKKKCVSGEDPWRHLHHQSLKPNGLCIDYMNWAGQCVSTYRQKGSRDSRVSLLGRVVNSGNAWITLFITMRR